MPLSTSDETDHLLAFLQDRDASCPNCGYNVRNLTKPICPECQEALLLKVGSRTYPIRWLLVTIAPGIFTGITAGIMAVLAALSGSFPKTIPLVILLTATFFTLSAVVAVVIISLHRRFIRQPQHRQVLWAASIWVIHLCAFFTFIAAVV